MNTNLSGVQHKGVVGPKTNANATSKSRRTFGRFISGLVRNFTDVQNGGSFQLRATRSDLRSLHTVA